ncbi:MotA/TolQ/ExbB proton channel family protein [Desulfonatronum parangueonense]
MTEQFLNLNRFMDTGGPVLWIILLVAVVLWTLLLERYWYHWRIFPRDFAILRDVWQGRACRDRALRDMQLRRDVGELRMRLNGSLFLVRTLIAVCPLLGLLGTVTGMIHVFDVLGYSGTGNPRAMASGVTMATIPTMAGLVVALSGFVFSIRLQRGSRTKTQWAADELLRAAHCSFPPSTFNPQPQSLCDADDDTTSRKAPRST